MPTLHWLNDQEARKQSGQLPYRLLEADSKLSYGDSETENMLIQGDNLEALKALLPYYAGQVKCIYIDPPYNTQSAFEHYDDNLEHSTWLAMMYPRLELLWQLLSPEDGVILISVNDDEAHYLKVICDEIFNRKNFMASLVWNYEGNTDNQAKIINYHEYIFVYAKSGKLGNLRVIDPTIGEASKLNRPEIRNTIVKNGVKNPPKSVEIPAGFPCSFEGGVIYKADVRFPKYSDDLIVKDFRTLNAVTATTGWSSKDILESFISNNFSAVRDSKGQQTVYEITTTGAIEAVKKREQAKGHFLSVLRGLGTTNQMRIMLEKLGIKFTFPKPVNLIAYLITAFSNENGIVLDSFAGSGTTAHAVLNINKHENLNLRFILVEREKGTAENIIVPRIQSVITGSNTAEIEATGGGFSFYHLGETVFNEQGHINEKVKFKALAAHVWFSETHTPLSHVVASRTLAKQPPNNKEIASSQRTLLATTLSPLLGVYNETAYYLLYNGILGDIDPKGGNVLTSRVLRQLPKHKGKKVIYGEMSMLEDSVLRNEEITFKHIPYDIKAR